MGTVTLQFHADPEELVSTLLPAWFTEVDVHVMVEVGASLRTADSISAVAGGPAPDRIFVRLEAFDVDSDDVREVLRRNPDGMAITVGRRRGDGLRESMLSTSAADATANAAWRRVVRRARSDLAKGGSWVGPSGATQSAPSHRYSPEAARLAKEGVSLLPVAGTSRFVPEG